MPKKFEIDILQHDIDHKNPHWLTPEGGLHVEPQSSPIADAEKMIKTVKASQQQDMAQNQPLSNATPNSPKPKSKTEPSGTSVMTRARPTKESLEALGCKVLPRSGKGFILPMGAPNKKT